jgi:hypothetical protein
LLARLLEHPMAERDDGAGFLGDRYEFVCTEQASR